LPILHSLYSIKTRKAALLSLLDQDIKNQDE